MWFDVVFVELSLFAGAAASHRFAGLAGLQGSLFLAGSPPQAWGLPSFRGALLPREMNLVTGSHYQKPISIFI